MMYQGHASDGGIQNHSVGESLRHGYIIGMDRDGWFALCAKTGRRTSSYPTQADANCAGKLKAFTRGPEPGTYTGGGRACRPSAQCDRGAKGGMNVECLGFMEYRVVGPGCQPSEPRRSYEEAVILLYSLLLRNVMHG